MLDSMHKLIHDGQAIFGAAVRGAQARRLLRQCDLEPWTATYVRAAVVGAGKAAMAMAGALEERVPGWIAHGIVAVPYGYRDSLPPTQRAPSLVQVVEAGHPMPDAAGLAASEQALAIAEKCAAGDLLIVLLSGGGSALWPAPAHGVTLADVQVTNRLLLRSGATIHQINTVRKHLSRIKGGWLAATAYPGAVLTLTISDVTGDDPSIIASGPTAADPSTCADARQVLRSLHLMDHAPASVRACLEEGAAETPGPGDVRLQGAQRMLLGSNRKALSAAAAEARALGYDAQLRAFDLTGEAREVGRAVAREALRQPAGACLLWGGETTVTLTGHGQGGRNQEVALAAALALEDERRPVLVLSGGTDGIDGPTDFAGAWATPLTAPQARALGLDAQAALDNNDAYPFFSALGSGLRTGPTHTNVMDIILTLAG